MTDEDKRTDIKKMFAVYPELAEKYKNVKYEDLKDLELDDFYSKVKKDYEPLNVNFDGLESDEKQQSPSVNGKLRVKP